MQTEMIDRNGPQRRVWYVGGPNHGTGVSMSIGDTLGSNVELARGGAP
jgi:hypothetical protein